MPLPLHRALSVQEKRLVRSPLIFDVGQTRMIKLLLQHLAALAAAIFFGAMFAVATVEALLPPVAPGFIPRPVGVAIYAFWIAGGTYLIIGGAMSLRRWRRKRADPFAVATPALFTTWGAMVALSLLVCLVDRFNHRLH